MSKKFRAQASSARAASAAFGSSSIAFGAPSTGFQTAASSLSYIAEQPHLGAISNPNLVVALRNLSKKDSTTKTKALEDLEDHVKSAELAEAIDSGLLEAWVSLYPRTSIDNARRVRQLAHTLQGSLTVISGKRIAPYLPKVVGSWLSGTYDSDRAVARAAQESLGLSFNTEDKRKALWHFYKTALIDYAEDAIFVQTSKTLSDERSTTPEDAEAKLVRVAGNAMHMLSQLIKNHFSGNARNQAEASSRISEVVQNKKLWQYSYHDDPSLRRAACTLVTICAQSLPDSLDWTAVSASFVGKALHSSQLGSSGQLSEAILALTMLRPELWTTDYTSKTTALKRLLQYLRMGSQRGPASFWKNIPPLLKKIPSQLWFGDQTDGPLHEQTMTSLLDALQAGITSSDEPRQNLETAWFTYVEASFWAIKMIDAEESKSAVLSKNVLPLVDKYVAPEPQQLGALPTSSGARIAGSILDNILGYGLRTSFEGAWHQFCQQLVDSMKLSMPETSKDFTKSQDGIIARSQRLFGLKKFVLEAERLGADEKTYASTVFQQADDDVMLAAIELLKSRNGKPYAAACILQNISASIDSPERMQPLFDFLRTDGLRLLQSPSAEYIMSIVIRTKQALEPFASELIRSEDGSYATKALSNLLRGVSEEELSKLENLQQLVLRKISEDLDNPSVQFLTTAIFQNHDIQSTEFRRLCDQKILVQLSLEASPTSQQATLQFLSNLVTNSRSSLSTLSDLLGGALLSKLLLLADSDNPEVAELATSLTSKLKSASSSSGSAAASSTLVVADQLAGRSTPLSIFALIDLSKEILRDSPSGANVSGSLMPSTSHWQGALRSHTQGRRPPSLAITSSLHGMLFMIEEDEHSPADDVRDGDEFSLLFRLVLYATRMLSDTAIVEHLSSEHLRTLYYYYPLALQLVNEKLTLETANNIWENTSDEVTEEAAAILSEGNALVQQWLTVESLIEIWTQDMNSVTDLTFWSYLRGLTFVDIISRFVDEHGPAHITSLFEAEFQDMHRSPKFVRSASLIAACRDHIISSQPGRRTLNELIAACTDLKANSMSANGLRSLILLDLLLNGGFEPLEGLPSQRVVFLMQALFRLVTDSSVAPEYQTLAMRLLDPVLTYTKDIYGDHWSQLVECIVSMWCDGNALNEDLPLLHASLRIYARLRTLATSEDSNEDLSDTWNASQESLGEGLLQVLQSFGAQSMQTDQPRRITAELLRRQLSQVSFGHNIDLYALLSSPEDAIRAAAYDLLHRSIPAGQEQLSMEVALENKAARLPEELLSLLTDIPGATYPLRQSYLLGWHLVFDHFTTASYKLQEMYAANIKDKNVLPGLLDLLCEICRITSGRPLDASKFDVISFEYGSSDNDEQEQQKLATHLYCCCLLYLPSLTRGWFIEQKNRVKSPLESWTQRYFSPTLMVAATRTVTEWAANQPQDDSEAPVTVKTSLSGSEAVASIVVAPESPPISLAISLPSTYPLDSPTVASRSRVGVSEKNWQSWLRTFQIIIFSTGSIIEGLIAFRRNVQGALKGQSECAICYSIIGTDMQTPNKRCGTCRNTFHGSCLFRWFKSSNSSSCPLCRNNFNYA
ncbi:armadillo-type protein [Exophiala viscosa]|uniref:E3 ubiquitin-protein ligase listerin n=1 Tax=Exophiala viscosa TaxID=2486360 RepID=A0AAN6IJ60_9EURO|nr:armadillo-type protein [Exophiala viscosa]